jgi:UDPglucose 6-dehydrogenase
MDKRIGESFLKPGPGFGGSCFPKDILALQQLSRKVNTDFLLLDAIIDSNDRRPGNILKKITKALGGALQGKKLAFLGLTYKAGTDDLRNSPAIKLISKLKEEGAKVVAYDPKGMVNAHKYFDELECAESAMGAIKEADAIIIITEWDEFRTIDYQQAKSIVKNPIIIDLRNILDSKELTKIGFKYYSIGKKSEG